MSIADLRPIRLGDRPARSHETNGAVHAGSPVAPEGLRMHRILSVVAAMGLFGPAFATWSAIVQIPLAGAAAVMGFSAILIVVLVAALARTEKTLRRLRSGHPSSRACCLRRGRYPSSTSIRPTGPTKRPLSSTPRSCCSTGTTLTQPTCCQH